MTPAGTNPDVVVIGGGNAALCAAITAAEAGARVLILEAAPKPYRGGNSRHTRNFRCMHQGPLGPLVDSYTEEEYLADLLKVTGGKTHEGLARLAIRTSEACLPWMEEHGVRFQPSLSGTLSLARTNAFFLGGGKGLVNAYYRTAERLGVEVVYEAQVTHLELDEDRITSVDYIRDGQTHRVTAKSVVVASGGFQADTDWLARAWGPAARNFLIRGTPYNRGVVLADLLAQDIAQVGDPTQCHAVAIDGRAPKFDGGIVTRLDCVPFSIVVNKDAERFYDEGEDVWPKRYAIWGRLVAAQPDQVGYVIIDAKSLNLFMPSVFPPIKADTLEELAGKLDLPAEALAETVATFNAACGDTSGFHPTELDRVATTGLTPPKTNWARPITEPPFYGYSLRTGFTFTYLGLKVDENAQCAIGDRPVTNLWAAGETMAGSILGQGYLAGFGMTIGTVFGRIAGKEAAAHAN
ncbi:FAD-dependent tricarballylate dehydrogenase TcuA [Pseudosulfitobacter pseudonitzschiae]|uniref:FAD-dependent tricarballylate dehydrogenase TcuA n=1 Tax=Pseudosulfitobacter pseudonitzschiae TaxID=1402135 RepID=UPI001AF201B5|nr:FAD-dependent tricarballylate dehydrogenase TcuA [Pseudosulfitobacter pseudonitzschiae]MBM1817391.1 FAD-dependent tricarballylate dehydrogenase TcuA [Pseudosulfitobacter pseudonitzschiae]MBM1834589.1 FAD-dependent tricarballylate dehydrogenase TcuA [Pseudosulfitobacter pseudonitzschiae]MBM1839454.1 FAD-dependent tricarballylate dehydrogenase TcuA [Pseudosulfitobacter pseudonitzschiae]MBM1844304.1 FAD-dependent tricarballylate dehydrogenase TcuA [Pseudosulfitobacter pseudonitzschiae]MBM18491